MNRSIPVTKTRSISDRTYSDAAWRGSNTALVLVAAIALSGCAILNADFPDSKNPAESPNCSGAKASIVLDAALTTLAVLATASWGDGLKDPGLYIPGTFALAYGASAAVGTTAVVKCGRARKAHRRWQVANRAKMEQQQESLEDEIARLKEATDRRESDIKRLEQATKRREGELLQMKRQAESQNEDVRQCRSGKKSLAKCKELASGYTRAGMTAFDSGEYDRAIQAYTNAHDILPHPLLLYNRADSYRNKAEAMKSSLRTRADFDSYRQVLGKSLNDYSIYLQTVDEPERHRYIREVMNKLERAILDANAQVDKLETPATP